MKRVLLFLCLLGFYFGFSQQITQVEYWFNDDFAGRTLQNISTNADDETNVSIAFPDNGTNEFYETLYFRFKDSAGNWSPIQSSQLFNANDTQIYPVQMEYWFDNNFAQKTTIPITATINPNGSLQIQEADVAWQTNAQTIYYRFKSKYNQWSAIQLSNIDQIPNVNNKIVSAEYWLNNDFANRQTTTVAQNNSFYLDIQNLNINSNDQETIHLRYKDKMNRWSSIYSFYSDYQGDEIEPTPSGTINLVTSKLASGKVNLTWNSVTNGKLYMIYRDGLYWRSLENSHHPQSLEAVDFPPLGNHSYYVVAKNYLNPNSITSNTDNETITQSDIDAQNDPNNPNQYGTLTGIIADANGNRIDDVQVTYSHDGYTVFSNLGQFKREGIAIGTQGTISLSKNGYTFTPVTNANYSITEPLQTKLFLGTSSGTNQNQTYSIEQTSNFTVLTPNTSIQYLQPFETKVTVKNIGTAPWSGKIQLVATLVDPLYIGITPTHKIIDEIQVTNLLSNQERIIEFYVDKLKLEPNPSPYNLFLRTYRLEGNICSSISDILINSSIPTSQINVGNNLNITTISQALNYIKDALEDSHTLSEILVDDTNPKMINEYLKVLEEDLQVAIDIADKTTEIINDINTIDSFLTANDFKDYWKALSNLAGYCSGGSFCKIINMYMDVTSDVLVAIDQIENLTYSGQANFNFLDGKKLELKIYKKKYWIGSFNEYFQSSAFNNQIESASFVGVNSSGNIMDNIPLSKVVCDNPADTETLCLVPPPMDYYYMEPGYKYLVKIIWTNGKITYVPFGTAYFDEDTDGNFEFKLNASKAGGNTNNIEVFAQPIFN